METNDKRRELLLKQDIRFEQDVVLTRQRARQISALLGFDTQDQTRIATAVSEIARNAFKYAGHGKVLFSIHRTADERSLFRIRIADEGPGIPHLDQVLRAQYESPTGMGMGIIGAQRLMDEFRVESARPQGTLVTLGKLIPRPVKPSDLIEITAQLAQQTPQTPIEELQQQNRELLRALEELRNRESELRQLNLELEDTNRGVVALYAELDEKAFSLARANDVKTRFLSNMTHEFRTPLNSVLSLSRLLLDRTDGELTAEQEKQVGYIRRSAESLSELVNDLLDLAKVEAGKVTVRASEFRVEDLFSTLRGMLKPLLISNNSVNLVFDPAEHLPPLETDEGKVAQILRNFISNALKYTERGEIRVAADVRSDGMMMFSVTDTGIGIAIEDQERIFEEYSQIDSPLQRRTKGTGLGLPLSRKLAMLLGGDIFVQSDLGKGSTFYAAIPHRYGGASEVAYVPKLTTQVDPARRPVLVIEDNRETMFVYEKYVKGSEYQVIPAYTIAEARARLREMRPVAVVSDILLQSENTWDFLRDLKTDETTRDIPLFVVTVIENEAKARAYGADAFHQKPLDRRWLLRQLDRAAHREREPAVLVVDDDEISRYLLRNELSAAPYRVLEAADGMEGLRRAGEDRPEAIILDLTMPDLDGFAVLERLKADSRTQAIPVIVYTSRSLSPSDRVRLNGAAAIVSKEEQTRRSAESRVLAVLADAIGEDNLARNSEMTS